LFYGNPDSPLDHPHGVNGIVVDKEGKNVYVTVTDYGRVVQIPIKRNGKAGEPKVIFESEPDKSPEQRALFGIDGIKIGPDGNFYIVVIRTDQLVAIKPGDSTHTVIVEGHPLDGPTQLAFGSNQRGKGDDENDHRVKSLPPLYIANGTGRRAFFLGIAAGQGGGSLWNGVKYLIDNGIITEDQAIGLQPRPSVARVLLKRDSD
jgi:sugar lactone lactonase YvrE